MTTPYNTSTFYIKLTFTAYLMLEQCDFHHNYDRPHHLQSQLRYCCCAVPLRRLYYTALKFYNKYLRQHHAISLAIFPCHSTTTTSYTTTADITAATATYRTSLSVTTSPDVPFSTASSLSGSTYHDYSNSNHTALSFTSTSPFLPSTTIASHTTHRSYQQHTDPVVSSTSTSTYGSSSSHRPSVAHAPGGLATLLSLSPSHTTFTSTFASTATTTSTGHRRLTTSSATNPTTDTIGPHSTSPPRHQLSHWLPPISITLHCISPTSYCTSRTYNRQARHQHHHHHPHTHLTAVDATTITKAGASLIITVAAAIDVAAGIDITAIPNTTAPPGDTARLPPPLTLTVPHLPAAAPDNPSTCDPTQMPPQRTALTLTSLNTQPQRSSVDHPTAGDLHPTFKLSHQMNNSSTGLNFMPTSSTPPTDPSTNTLPISFPTATSLTKTSPTFDNTPM